MTVLASEGVVAVAMNHHAKEANDAQFATLRPPSAGVAIHSPPAAAGERSGGRVDCAPRAQRRPHPAVVSLVPVLLLVRASLPDTPAPAAAWAAAAVASGKGMK